MILQENVVRFSAENLKLKPRFNRRLQGSAFFEAMTDTFTQQYDFMFGAESYVNNSVASRGGLMSPMAYMEYLVGDDYERVVKGVSDAIVHDITTYRAVVKPQLERTLERVMRALESPVGDMPLISVNEIPAFFECEDTFNMLSVSTLSGMNYQFPRMSGSAHEGAEKVVAALGASLESRPEVRHWLDSAWTSLPALVGELFFDGKRSLFHTFYAPEQKVFFMPLREEHRKLLVAAYLIMQLVRRDESFAFQEHDRNLLEVCERMLGHPIYTYMKELVRQRSCPINELVLVTGPNAQIRDNRVVVEAIAYRRLCEAERIIPHVIIGAVTTKPKQPITVGDVLANIALYTQSAQRVLSGLKEITRERTGRVMCKEVMACIADYRDSCGDEERIDGINHRMMNGERLYFPSVDLTDRYCQEAIWSAIYEAWHRVVWPEMHFMKEIACMSTDSIPPGVDPQDYLTEYLVMQRVVSAIHTLAQRKAASATA